jgi:TetR/AcrR family transcriptional regulator, transcriptional repressor for nem operon
MPAPASIIAPAINRSPSRLVVSVAAVGSPAVKVTKEHAAENRKALVKAAGRLIREHGIDGVGVADISKAAGLTHGALYAQFASKEALAAEALAEGLDRSFGAMIRAGADAPDVLVAFLDFYLATSRRDDFGGNCAMAAAASEIGRLDEAASAHFVNGFEEFAGAFESVIDDRDSGPGPSSRQRALATVSALVGGVSMSRAARKADPQLADEILHALRAVLETVGRAPAAAPAPAPARRRRTAG